MTTQRTSDFKRPFNDLTKYIPSRLKNEVNTSLLDNLFNRFMTQNESVPFYGFIGEGDSYSPIPQIPQRDFERKINEIVPVLTFKNGTEQFNYTVQDLIKQAETMGVADNGHGWLYTQANNFMPPITLDKFVNYQKYFWAVPLSSVEGTLPWNPTNSPEYYVIAQPETGDKDKKNVRAATTETATLTGSGFVDMDFIVEFTSDTEFTVKPSTTLGGFTASNGAYVIDEKVKTFKFDAVKGNIRKTLLTFTIECDPIYDYQGNEIGYGSFTKGDTFTISAPFITTTYQVSFKGGYGVKGKITKVRSLNEYQTIDGVALREGDRVLVKNASGAEAGIYVTTSGIWQRASDSLPTIDMDGAKVWVREGDVNGQYMFTGVNTNQGLGWTKSSTRVEANTNDWQEGNYWVHEDDLNAAKYDLSTTTQAVLPIIEYKGSLKLNGFVDNGLPSDKGIAYTQNKNTFNQLPLFDLYRYDGSHSGMVSPLFFYEESPVGVLENSLQKRIKHADNSSNDFIFNHGMYDLESGHLLFAKSQDGLVSIWAPGYTTSVIAATSFEGSGDGKIESVSVINPDTFQQRWVMEFKTENTFSVIGDRTGKTDDGVVGKVYNNGEISFLITQGTIPFESNGDKFSVVIGNLERPSFTEEGTMNNFTSSEGRKGAWKVSKSFYNNPYSESRSPLTEGSMNAHFRSIMAAQTKGVVQDDALGGEIKLWGEQHGLMASLLMQRDLTPNSMIELAEKMYDNSLNSVKEIYQQDIVNYLGTVGSVKSVEDVNKLLDYILEVNAKSDLVKNVLFDTTSPVRGFPATLPQMACAELFKPGMEHSAQLGIDVIRHHDGHLSEVYVNGIDFNQMVLGNLLNNMVERSDGKSTPAIGSFTDTPPAKPYRGELWTKPSGVVLSFACTFDTKPTSMNIGDSWYDREADKAFVYSNSEWVEISKDSLWATVNFAGILNNLIIELETRLYEGINPNARKINFSDLEKSPAFQEEMKNQLYTFSALNGYDPSGTDYDPLNPFTWNYSSLAVANSAPVVNGKVPARWFDYLTSHQETVSGVVPTIQPHAEPWKLFGFTDGSQWWNSLSSEKQKAYIPDFMLQDIPSYNKIETGVVAVQTTYVTGLSGLGTIDGVQVSTGDKVLVVNNGALNGVWSVSNGPWSKVSISINATSYVLILQGEIYGSSYWVTTNGIEFKQARVWTMAMWSDIAALHPSLKLSVNVYHDKLLPPYVSTTSPVAKYALTNTTISGAGNAYEYGQNSPIESIWKQTTNYLYARVRALFRYDPLAFLGLAWGFNWVDVNGVLLDGIDMGMPGVKRTRLHGDPLNIIGKRKPLLTSGVISATTFVYSAYDTDRKQNFTVFQNGVVVGYIQEGVPTEINGMTVMVEDEGIPFHIGDIINITADGTVTFLPVGKNNIMGFGQIFTNALRSSNVDTNRSYAISAYRNWDVKMSYRVGGLVSTEDLTVSTLMNTLSQSSYDIVFKKNLAAFDTWLQSLRVSVAKFGAADVSRSTNIYKPVGDASDWVFKIEGFNPRKSNIDYYKMDTTKDLSTFKSLSGETTDRIWNQPTVKLSEGRFSMQLPVQIEGLQNTIDFLYGYVLAIEEDGWTFNNGEVSLTDAETGRTRTMQLEIEKMINSFYRGVTPEQGTIINPFIDRVWLKQPRGMIAPFQNSVLFDVQSHPGVFDVLGVKYNKEDLNIIRTNDISSIGSSGPMFSVHAQLDEYEHLFIFEDWIEPSVKTGLLYDAFTGGRVLTYQFNGMKQESSNMRPEYGGHYLVGSEVRKNLQASTDVIQNLYDANHVYEDKKTTKESLALLGFQHKTYFDDLDISSKSQFNFWRGLIQTKGSNKSIDAYLNNGRFDEAKIDEYWAYKIAEYGDDRQRIFPEMRINVSDVTNQLTQLQFTTEGETVLPGFTAVSTLDENRWFTLDDVGSDLWFTADPVGTFKTDNVKVGQIISLDFIADSVVHNAKTGNFIQPMYEYSCINATTIKIESVGVMTFMHATGEWVEIKHSEEGKTGKFELTGYGPARPKFNPVKLINYQAGEMVENIPVWHPATGVYTPAALEAINIISDKDPASYNMTTQKSANVSYDPLRPWGKTEVGRTWLNTTNLKFVPYYDSLIFPEMGERLSRWGALADTASVDVYEWVQSSVPPAEYDKLSLVQAGDGDIDPSMKADGTVANPKLNMRKRAILMHPVAWAYNPIATDVDYGNLPYMIHSSSGMRFENGMAILEQGVFENVGSGASSFVAGVHVGAWFNDDENPYPVTEYEVTDSFTKTFIDSRADNTSSDQGFSCTVDIVSTPESYNPSLVGQLIFDKAPIILTPTGYSDSGQVTNYDVKVPLRVSAIGVGISEDLITLTGIGTMGTGAVRGATFNTISGQRFEIQLKLLGLKVVVTSTTTSNNVPLDALRNAIVNSLNVNISVQDAVMINPIIADIGGATYTTNAESTSRAAVPYGWRAWRIPTQADLDSDSLQPVVSWKAYVGKPAEVNPTKDVLNAATAYLSAPLTLNNGEVIPRYSSSWSDWTLLQDITKEVTQIEDGNEVDITFEDVIPESRLLVLVNGSLQLKSAYSISGKTVKVMNVNKGSIVSAIVRKYEPVQSDLDFDPEKDPTNMNTLVQYKMDYDYVETAVRTSDGNIASSVYYFWVKNRSSAAKGKRMSIRMAARELAEGPDSYLTFQNYHHDDIRANSNSKNTAFVDLNGGYDAVTISGLSYVVTKDDTFKLRFTRDFTLRDDPEDLNLKNVHTEWTLIRETQRTRIPDSLWWKLVDSAVGSDVAGNSVPALRRVLYDERHGTRTRFGFNDEQTLAPSNLLRVSLLNSVLNTNQDIKVGDVYSSNSIEGLDYDKSDEWFVDDVSTRNTLTTIWNNGTPLQINTVFFGVLGDILASNYELTDLFKTSRLSAHSIKVVRQLGT